MSPRSIRSIILKFSVFSCIFFTVTILHNTFNFLPNWVYYLMNAVQIVSGIIVVLLIASYLSKLR